MSARFREWMSDSIINIKADLDSF